jgi:hypothetical protein
VVESKRRNLPLRWLEAMMHSQATNAVRGDLMSQFVTNGILAGPGLHPTRIKKELDI